MKKIFTLLAASLLSATALQAVEVTFTHELDLDGFSAWPSASYDAETKTLTPSAAYGGGSKWYGTCDASDYHQIVFELAEVCAQPVACNVYYTGANQEVVIAAGATSGTVDLVGTNIEQVSFAVNGNVTGVPIKISRVYLVGTRIKKAGLVTLNETETEIGNWNAGIGFGGASFNGAHAGDQVVINVAPRDSATITYHQLQATSNGKHLESFPYNAGISAGTTQFRFTLTENDVDSLQKNGLYVGGYYITISSIQLQKFAVIKDAENSFSADWKSGAFQAADVDMPTLEDGDSLCVEVKTAVAGGQIMLQHTTAQDWSNFSPEFQHVFSAEDVAAMPKTFYMKFTTARITELGSYKLCVNGNNFTLTKVYIIKGTPDQGGTVALDQVSQGQGQSQKLIKDGQLFILRDGKTYTLQGQLVK